MAGGSETGPINEPAKRGPAVRDRWNHSKVTPPTLANVVSNARIEGRIAEALEKPVVWLQGPPGAGKTTAVSRTLASIDTDPVWFRLDADDIDPATFFFYLALACARVDPAGAATLPEARPQYFREAEAFSRRFFRALFGRAESAIVVFDDYQDVDAGSVIHELLAEGLKTMPADSRMIFISRAPPPPAYARLRLNGSMDVIPTDLLCLDVEDAARVAAARRLTIAPDVLARLVAETHGWTAGLILMMEAASGAQGRAATTERIPEIIFDYFAGEVFHRLGERERRDLMILAVVPSIPGAIVGALTGDDTAIELVDRLARQSYFTSRDRGAEPHYRFHPLFRDFLKARGASFFDAAESRRLHRRAAEALETCGQVEGAAALYGDQGEWTCLARLIVRTAPALVGQGRYATLTAWLERLPKDHVVADGWLSFWSATALLATRPDASRPLFRAAFDLFRAAEDFIGAVSAWCGLANSVIENPYSDQSDLDGDLALVEAFMPQPRVLPAVEIEFRFALTMYLALNRRSADRETINFWRDRALRAAAAIGVPAFVILMRNYIALYALIDGDFATVREQFAVIPPAMALKDDPLLQAIAFVSQGLGQMFGQIDGRCEDTAEQALAASRESGIYLWTHFHAGMEATAYGDLPRAQKWLRKTAQLAGRVASYHGAHYQIMATAVALLAGDVEGAVRSGRLAVDLTLADGWFLYEAIARVELAQAYDSAGDAAAADRELAAAGAAADHIAARSIVISILFLRADFLLQRGESESGLDALREAMRFADRTGGRRTLLTPRRASRICARALVEDIAPDRAMILIESSRLPPPDVAVERWPWPLKIVSLGGFGIFRDGEPIAMSRKTPRRLITLLKAIIAFGATNVQAEHLVDAVWPDEEGDAGHRALDTALYRLRKLIGDPQVLVVRAGRISLDPQRVWLDLWAFEGGLTRAANLRPDSHVLSLYKGDFLAGDDDPWIEPRRRKLATRYRNACPTD